MNARTISEALGGRPCGDGYIMCCLAHDDRNPSLSVKDSDRGYPLVHCHAGCAFEDIREQLRKRGLWPESRLTPHMKQQHINNKYMLQSYKALGHELHVMYQVVSNRICDDTLKSTPSYKKGHPEFKPLPLEFWDRELQAVKTISKLFEVIYGK